MNNLLSHFGLTDSRMRASEKDLPVKVEAVQVADFLENVDLDVEESTVSSTVVDSVTVAIAKLS